MARLDNLETLEELAPEKLIKRFNNLINLRRLWEPIWQTIAEYMLPSADDVVTRKPPGNPRTQKLFDSTAIFAAELLAASIHGTLTSGYTRWFSLTLPDPALDDDGDVRTWLDTCATILYSGFNTSNFNQEVHEMYTTLVPFGTGCLLFEEKEGKKGAFQFKSIRLQDMALAEGPDGKVNTVFRKFPLTRSSILERWPKAEKFDYFKNDRDPDPDKAFTVVQAVMPVPKTARGKFKYVSVYVLDPAKEKLETTGNYEFPYMVPRWTKQTGETYGRGRGHTALPDVRTLNKLVELELRALGKVVNPPVKAKGGDTIGQVKLNAGGVTTVRDMESLAPLFQGFDYKPVNLKKEELTQKVRQMFYSDQLEMQQGPQMTATEVNVRYELMQRILGPTLGRLESEFLDEVIARAFNIKMRAGELPPPPQQLLQKNAVMNVRYEGPLARAQKSGDIEAVAKLESLVEPLLPTMPNIMDNINVDGLIAYSAQTLGIPARFILSQAQVDDKRQQAAAVQQQQEAHASMAAHAQAAGQAAPMVKALGQAPQPGSPLDQMQQQQGGPAANATSQPSPAQGK